MRDPSADAPRDPAALDAALEDSLATVWDAQVVPYDRVRFPIAETVLGWIRARGYPLDALARLHEVVPQAEVYALTKALCAETARPDFRELVHELVRHEVVPRGRLVPPIAVQRFLNVRVMLPASSVGIFPFHTGLLYGHGPASRSLWLPLTDVTRPEDASASMRIIGLARSRELVAEATAARLSVAEMSERFTRESRPLAAGPGQMVLFNQENIHGNVVNATGKTRVSVDFRVAEGRFGDRLAKKPAGGYFALLPEPRADEGRVPPPPAAASSPSDGRPVVVYLANATPATAGAPVHLQRYMVADYLARRGLTAAFELFELDAMAHLPTLRHIADGLGAHAVLYSVYALPEDAPLRAELLDAFAAAGATMHFVNEDLRVSPSHGRADLEALLAFARYGAGAGG